MGVDRSTASKAEGVAGVVKGVATRMTRGSAGRQGRPFPTFAVSDYKCNASALHCLARSEVQVIQILFVTSRVCFVVLVHKQLRCVAGIISVSEKLHNK